MKFLQGKLNYKPEIEGIGSQILHPKLNLKQIEK